MSIADKISLLQSAKTAIQAKLVEKGVSEAGSHGFSQFAGDIGLLQPTPADTTCIIIAFVKTDPLQTDYITTSYLLTEIIPGPVTGVRAAKFTVVDDTAGTTLKTVFTSLPATSDVPVVGTTLWVASGLIGACGTVQRLGRISNLE